MRFSTARCETFEDPFASFCAAAWVPSGPKWLELPYIQSLSYTIPSKHVKTCLTQMMASSCLDTDHLQRHLHILHLAASKMDCNFWASIMLPLIFSLPPMKACIPSSLPSAMATKSASAIVMVQSLQPVEFKPLQAKGARNMLAKLTKLDSTLFNYIKMEVQVFYVTWRDVKSCQFSRCAVNNGDSSDSAEI